MDDLEQLLSDALAARPTDKPKRLAHRARLAPGYTDLKNWSHTRYVSLVHRSTSGMQTLLGNFNETVCVALGARKLTRVEEPHPTDGIEEVSGDWWLTPIGQEGACLERWISERDLTIGATLAECGLHCPDTPVRVRLAHGGIARVELTSATRFGCPARNKFLVLPSGLDILSSMSIDSKLELRSMLLEGEGSDPETTGE